MSDLISRQDIEWHDYLVADGNGMYHNEQIAYKSQVDELPSAQPERLTDDDFETIRIHLNAHKEKLCNQHRWKEADEYQRIIDRFMAFASAQPTQTNTPNALEALDCVGRQAALGGDGDD